MSSVWGVNFQFVSAAALNLTRTAISAIRPNPIPTLRVGGRVSSGSADDPAKTTTTDESQAAVDMAQTISHIKPNLLETSHQVG